LRVSEAFRDAEVLADFANLDPEEVASVAYFRNNYPDFAPAEWWDYQTQSLELVRVRGDDSSNVEGKIEEHLISVWEDTQDELRRAWEDQFKFESVFNLTELLKMVFVAPSEMVLSAAHLYLPDGTFHELSTSKVWSFHKAVLYLHENGWRARVCRSCERYFVANHPQRDFCQYPDARGETCRDRNDNKRKLDYYYTTGKKERQAKHRKRKSSPRLPGSGRQKAAAKT
jgi:hypothetical protein